MGKHEVALFWGGGFGVCGWETEDGNPPGWGSMGWGTHERRTLGFPTLGTVGAAQEVGPPLVVPLPSIGTPLWEPPRVGTNRLGAVGWEGDCWDSPGWGPLR